MFHRRVFYLLRFGRQLQTVQLSPFFPILYFKKLYDVVDEVVDL